MHAGSQGVRNTSGKGLGGQGQGKGRGEEKGERIKKLVPGPPCSEIILLVLPKHSPVQTLGDAQTRDAACPV